MRPSLVWLRKALYASIAATLACGGDGPTAPPAPPGPAPVAVVQFDAAAIAMRVGQVRTLSVAVRDAVGTALAGRAVTWSSSDPGIAEVTSAGVVTATAAGAASISATVEGKTASLAVTVTPIPIGRVAVTLSATSVYVGGTLTATAAVTDSAGNTVTGRPVTWSTSNSAVAVVSSGGIVTAKSPGLVLVIAEVEGARDTGSVAVALVPVTSVVVSPANAALYVGGTIDLSASAKDSSGNQLTGRAVSWSTSNAAVATVSSTGVVGAIAPGTVTITATVEGKTAAAIVTVALVPVATVSVSPSAASLYVGGTVDLSATARDSAGNAVTGRAIAWSTGNPAVATVSSTGVVSAVSPGTATITATVEGKTANASVTVALVPVSSVTVSPSSSVLYIGQTVDLGTIARDSAGNVLTGRAVTWSTSNSSIASVSASGVVTSLGAGSATITATVEGKTGTASITSAVVPVKTVTLSQGDATLYQTATLDYDASAADSAGNALTGRALSWSSSNTGVATVSPTGVVAAVAQGEATITATVEGKTATARITVRHDPIFFVHGFGSNASVWSTMTSRFATDGWRSADMLGWGYNSLQSNVTTASSLRTTIDSLLSVTGARRVDIVTHSMGGLPSRYYLKNLDGTKVDAWVSLGGPNHGTDTADLCAGTYVSCAEMQIGSAFLAALNTGDETPGSTRYATWWSPCDTTINPDDTVALAGATNTQTACLGHSALYTDLAVYGQVRDWVR